MATSGISAPTDGRVKISDTYLEKNFGNPGAAVIDVVKLQPVAAFENVGWNAGRATVIGGGRGNNAHYDPRGVLIDGARDGEGGVDETASSGFINGALRNEPNTLPFRERYQCANLHPIRFRYIHPNRTTARGIKIHS